jgi:hypothetical protein
MPCKSIAPLLRGKVRDLLPGASLPRPIAEAYRAQLLLAGYSVRPVLVETITTLAVGRSR